MDPRVVTELQDVKVASLSAVADAVDPAYVGTLALHGKNRTHHLLVAVMLETRGPGQGAGQPQEESPEPG